MDPIFWEGQLPGAHLTPGISLGGGQARTHKGLAFKQKPATGLPIGREGVEPGAHLSTHPGPGPLKQSTGSRWEPLQAT